MWTAPIGQDKQYTIRHGNSERSAAQQYDLQQADVERQALDVAGDAAQEVWATLAVPYRANQ